jgi:hypothetical protein
VWMDIVNAGKRYILTRNCLGPSCFLDFQMIG